jgi:putative heme-binding domain-containing protein
LQAIDALITGGDEQARAAAQSILVDRASATITLRGALISALVRLDDPRVAATLLKEYPTLEAELKPRVIEVLTARKAWSKALLTAIATKELPAEALNANQVRNLLSTGDKELEALVTKTWGTIRTARDPAREQLVADMRKLIRSTPGDPRQGAELYKKLCGQCHKLHGEGQEVGPDITVNGRGSFEQLLSNVFDPSLVIGASYQGRTVLTTDGRVLTGLMVEDNDKRIVLKQQGGKLETIARAAVEEVKVSDLSLMPEGIEKQYKPQEIADLFAYLTLDKPPSDPSARKIPGTKELKPHDEHDPQKYREILDETLPGFTTPKSGIDGIGLVQEHHGRQYVVRTHPVDRNKPCILSRTVEIPADKKTRLALGVSHHVSDQGAGDWRLIVKVDGRAIYQSDINSKTTQNGWLDASIDLTPYAGKTIALELLNQPTDWFYEHAYWSRAESISE